MLPALFATIAAGLSGSTASKTEKFGEAVADLSELLTLPSLLLTSTVGFSPAEALQALGTKLSEKSLEVRRDRVRNILRGAQKKIVVLIDDIDRLDRKEMHALFKTVKLSADFDYVTYVLAFDDVVVKAALAESYGDLERSTGQSFLEKIVQVPLHLPQVERDALDRAIFSRIEDTLRVADIDLPEFQANEFARRFNRGLSQGLQTPRQIELYANALLFALPLLKGEVNTVDQLLIEGIRVLYPKVYGLVLENRHLLVRWQLSLPTGDGKDEERKSFLESTTEGMGKLEREGVSGLLSELFPLLRSTGSGDEDRHFREQRICSDRYFPRYFMYAVPVQDVSDILITDFLEGLPTGSEESVVRGLEELFDGDHSLRVIERLRSHEESLPPEAASKLAIAVSQNADLISREPEFRFYSAWDQASQLVCWLLKRSRGKERLKQAQEILVEHAPVDFAAACFRLMRISETDSEEEILFAEKEEEKILGEALSVRIEHVAQGKWLFDAYGRGAPRLMHIWRDYGDSLQGKKYVESALHEAPARVCQYLVAFTGVRNNDLGAYSSFEREEYEKATRFADFSVIRECLREVFGDEDLEASRKCREQHLPAGVVLPQDASLEFRVANEFLQIQARMTADQEVGSKEMQEGDSNLEEASAKPS